MYSYWLLPVFVATYNANDTKRGNVLCRGGEQCGRW
jgi:hypothetical protein